EIVQGKKQKADPEEFKAKKYKKHIFNELDYTNPELWTIELLGSEQVNREDCYKIQAISAGGEKRHLYYSKQHKLMTREDNVSNTEKGKFSYTQFSDFKKFGDLLYWSTVKFGEGDKLMEGKIVSITVNEGVTEKDFQ